jgi:hypothetical protein
MRWVRATVALRLVCLVLGVASLGVAWRLTMVGASGAENVPPPFTLLAGLTGLGFVCMAIVGRYPRPDA